MNINQNIRKLLYALAQKEKLYKISSFQSFNMKEQKYCTMFKIFKRDIVDSEEIYYLSKECFSKMEVLKYLADENKGSEADE